MQLWAGVEIPHSTNTVSTVSIISLILSQPKYGERSSKKDVQDQNEEQERQAGMNKGKEEVSLIIKSS